LSYESKTRYDSGYTAGYEQGMYDVEALIIGMIENECQTIDVSTVTGAIYVKIVMDIVSRIKNGLHLDPESIENILENG
jgi:hypothetical protein